jgi:hypothetical protein
VISFDILKEKFNATGLLPVKFVSKNPPHNEGYIPNIIKFNNRGIITPVNRIRLLGISIFKLFFFKSILTIIKKGIRKKAVGFIIMLIPRIILPINCHLIVSYFR